MDSLHGPARPPAGRFVTGALLPEAVGSVGRLILHGGVPPRVKMDHVVGGGKVEPLPARLQADEEEIALASDWNAATAAWRSRSGVEPSRY